MSLKQNDSSDMLKQTALALTTSGLLSIAFLDQEYYLLIWFAFVPLLHALQKASYLKIYLMSLLAGTCAYMTGMYWVIDFVQISKGFSLGKSVLIASIYWLYCGHLIAFLFLSFKWIQRNIKWHNFIIFPVVVTIFTSMYPMVFAMRLGDSQTQFYSAIQAIEYVGVHGLDALIALVNILLFTLFQCFITRKVALASSQKIPLAMAFLIIVFWFSFGVVQVSKWDRKIETWGTKRVGIVQPNETPKLGKRTVYPGYSYGYPPEMEMSERLTSLGAQLIVWPEAQTKEYLNNDNVSLAFQHNIKAMGTPLVFQDTQNKSNTVSGGSMSRISAAIMLDENGQQTGFYQKNKRIPFGESIPFFHHDSIIYNWVKTHLGAFYTELSAGKDHAVFQTKELNIIPLICYETTFPNFVASAVRHSSKSLNKQSSTVLVAMSNDGWFGSTHQPFQHVMPSVLRAVENRLPMIHVANNGPSIIVMPNGKVIFNSDFQQAGGYLIDMPISPKISSSFYSQYPNIFDRVIVLLFVLMLVISLCSLLLKKRTTF